VKERRPRSRNLPGGSRTGLAVCLLAFYFLTLAPNPSEAVQAVAPDSSRARIRSSADGCAWGLTAGVPQLLGITFETSQARPLRLQFSASPLLLINSASGRVILLPDGGRLRPYVFAGGGVLNVAEGESGDWIGTTGFYWGGAGARFHAGRAAIFFEVGGLGGMERSVSNDTGGHAFALGILIRT
jgi:hypothetical protein